MLKTIFFSISKHFNFFINVIRNSLILFKVFTAVSTVVIDYLASVQHPCLTKNKILTVDLMMCNLKIVLILFILQETQISCKLFY